MHSFTKPTRAPRGAGRAAIGAWTYLTPINTALPDLTDAELRAVAVATYDVPLMAPGLLAWREQACNWEGNGNRLAKSSCRTELG